MKLEIVFILISTFILTSSAYKILGFFHFGSHSHFVTGDAILKALHGAGHDITVVSPFPQKKPLKNFREINTVDILDRFKSDQLLNALEFRKLGTTGILQFISSAGVASIDMYMNHPKVLDLMNSKEKFDACIFENFNAEALMGLVEHFDCVLLTYTSLEAVTWIDYMTSNLSPPSYVPNTFSYLTDKMTLSERFTNFLTFTYEKALFYFRHLPTQRKLHKKYFPNAKRSLDDILTHSAVIFMNTHVSATSPRPYMPNVVEINGIHVKPAEKLPKDIQEFLDSATDGAIVFSLGSIIQAHKLPVEKREAFVRAFGKLKQKVIWKYENETLPDKPDNVMIRKWVPQRDILAHPNIKLFITHGGGLGTTESIAQGIPYLGIPVYGDQMMNMAKAVARGNGLEIPYEDISEAILTEKLREILDNPKYMEKAQTIAKRFNDRPLTPQQSVIYWTEYAIRHKGAEHLRAAGTDLNFIEFHMIDIYFIIFVISYLAYAAIKFI